MERRELSQNALKVLIDLFQKVAWVFGFIEDETKQRPDPTSAEVGIPKTSKKFLFLVLVGLISDQTGSSDKGEKVQLTSLDRKLAVAFLFFQVNATAP